MSALHGQSAAGGWGRRQQTLDVSDLTPEKFARTLLDARKHGEALAFLRSATKIVEQDLAETSAQNASNNRLSPAQKMNLATEAAAEAGTNESWWTTKPSTADEERLRKIEAIFKQADADGSKARVLWGYVTHACSDS